MLLSDAIRGKKQTRRAPAKVASVPDFVPTPLPAGHRPMARQSVSVPQGAVVMPVTATVADTAGVRKVPVFARLESDGEVAELVVAHEDAPILPVVIEQATAPVVLFSGRRLLNPEELALAVRRHDATVERQRRSSQRGLFRGRAP